MPRERAQSPDETATAAMHHFWVHGYCGSAMDDLVKATGSSRHGIYSAFGDKRGLFLAALDTYAATVVSPAFAQVEAPGADLGAIAAYFAQQIDRAEAGGLPGRGCLLVNSQTEGTTQDGQVREKVEAHCARLTAGFANALRGEAPGAPAATVERLAGLAAVFTQGLWAMFRSASEAATLRRAATDFVDLLREGLTRSQA